MTNGQSQLSAERTDYAPYTPLCADTNQQANRCGYPRLVDPVDIWAAWRKIVSYCAAAKCGYFLTSHHTPYSAQLPDDGSAQITINRSRLAENYPIEK